MFGILSRWKIRDSKGRRTQISSAPQLGPAVISFLTELVCELADTPFLSPSLFSFCTIPIRFAHANETVFHSFKM